MPGGLDWDQLDQLLGPVLGSERLIGLSVADLRPDLDSDERGAERLVALLEAKLRATA